MLRTLGKCMYYKNIMNVQTKEEERHIHSLIPIESVRNLGQKAYISKSATDRQTDRQTERGREKEGERDRDRQTDRLTDRQRDRDRETNLNDS